MRLHIIWFSFEFVLDKSEESREVFTPKKNFLDAELLDNWLPFSDNICAEEKLFFPHCIHFMRSLEVFLNCTHRHVQVQFHGTMKSPDEKVNQKAICSILISHKLYFHGSELDSPPDFIIWGDFQPNWVPVGSIEHLKQSILFIAHGFEFIMHDQDVPLKNVRDVRYHSFIDFDVQFFRRLFYIIYCFWFDVRL